jgi:hypothetical protein
MPAKAGIQQPRCSDWEGRANVFFCGVLDHPLSRMMTAVYAGRP